MQPPLIRGTLFWHATTQQGTRRQSRCRTTPRRTGGGPAAPTAPCGVRTAHAPPPRRCSARLQQHLGWPRLLPMAGAHAIDRRAARCCCCWRPLAPARSPAAVLGVLRATIELLWARLGALRGRSGAHGTVRQRPGRSMRNTRRQPVSTVAAATAHEPHTSVYISKSRYL